MGETVTGKVSRDYQEECINLINGLDHGSFLIVMATGLGKTWVFTHIKRKGRVLILSHREELVHQPESYYQDCSFSVERAEETSNGEDVISASVQTLIRRLPKFRRDEFDTIITDEAHHAVAPSYQKIYEYFQPRLHLGFTATPNRADNVKLGKIFSKVLFERNIKWGIENHWLCNVRCERVDVGFDLRNVKSQMGDFNQHELEDAVDITECNEIVAKVYKEKAIGPTLIFASSVSHAENLAALIPQSAIITGSTENRGDILEKFAKGDIPCIINCMVLTEGTDLPMVRTIIVCRPTQNASLYAQVVGRGLRPYEGKAELLLIDCVGVSNLNICTAPVLFGIDTGDTEYNGTLLTDVERKVEEEKEEKELLDPESYKINFTLVDIFEQKGGYDTHNVNYTICPNGSMVCSVGDGIIIELTGEDMTGNCDLSIQMSGRILYALNNIKVQAALDWVFMYLQNNYSKKISLWDKRKCMQWGKAKASDSQKDYIKSLYSADFLEKINMDEVTKYQASCLINQGLHAKRIKQNKSISSKEVR